MAVSWRKGLILVILENEVSQCGVEISWNPLQVFTNRWNSIDISVQEIRLSECQTNAQVLQGTLRALSIPCINLQIWSPAYLEKM